MQNIYVVYSDITTVPRNLHDEILSYTYIESWFRQPLRLISTNVAQQSVIYMCLQISFNEWNKKVVIKSLP